MCEFFCFDLFKYFFFIGWYFIHTTKNGFIRQSKKYKTVQWWQK